MGRWALWCEVSNRMLTGIVLVCSRDASEGKWMGRLGVVVIVMGNDCWLE